MVYIQEICKKTKTESITWFLNDFDCECKRKDFQRKVEAAGFKGKFSTFRL
jgi:hypothetical protein